MKWIRFRRIVMKNTIIATREIIAGMIYLISGILNIFSHRSLVIMQKGARQIDCEMILVCQLLEESTFLESPV
jgi:hypothetical protein